MYRLKGEGVNPSEGSEERFESDGLPRWSVGMGVGFEWGGFDDMCFFHT